MGITRDNHFVPQLYLNNFATASGEVHEYRTLVPDARVPLLKTVNAKGTGYGKDLYTRIVQGEESDDIENWLNRDFESPATKPLQKVLEDEELTPYDWEILIRFLAAQIVRTPAFLVRNLPHWNRMTREALDETFKEADAELQKARASGRRLADISTREIPRDVAAFYKEFIPMRVDRKELPEEKKAEFSSTVLVGRGHWFFTMKILLTRTVKVLLKHKWTILEAPSRLPWFTSDDPVICLNFRSESEYDFGGGWGRRRANILFH